MPPMQRAAPIIPNGGYCTEEQRRRTNSPPAAHPVPHVVVSLPGREYIGLARLVIREAMASDGRISEFLGHTVNQLRARFVLHGSMRTETPFELKAFALRSLAPELWLIEPSITANVKLFAMSATMIGSQRQTSSAWKEPREEPGIAVNRVQLHADRDDVWETCEPAATLSLHCIARYSERTGKRALGELMPALRVFANV